MLSLLRIDFEMKILVVIPHHTLLSPQGARVRLNGLISLLHWAEIHFLIPDNTPTCDRNDLPPERVYFFREPRIGPLHVPHLLDRSTHFAETLAHITRQNKFDLVVFNFPWGLSGARKTLNIPLVLLSHGVEAQFAKTALSNFGLARFGLGRFNFNFVPISTLFRSWVTHIESEACRASDHILCMSELDKSELTKRYRLNWRKLSALSQPARHRPALHHKHTIRHRYGLPLDKCIAVFHGSWAHPPNQVAYHTLMSEIVPAVQQANPNLFFVTAGAGMPVLTQPGVRGVGFIEDLGDLLSCADLGVVPIFGGAGVRMKIYDYFMSNIPVVSTKKGAEGMEINSGEHALIADDTAAGMVTAILQLAADGSLRDRLTAGAQDWLIRNCDPNILSQALRTRLEELVHGSSPQKAVAAG